MKSKKSICESFYTRLKQQVVSGYCTGHHWFQEPNKYSTIQWARSWETSVSRQAVAAVPLKNQTVGACQCLLHLGWLEGSVLRDNQDCGDSGKETSDRRSLKQILKKECTRHLEVFLHKGIILKANEKFQDGPLKSASHTTPLAGYARIYLHVYHRNCW